MNLIDRLCMYSSVETIDNDTVILMVPSFKVDEESRGITVATIPVGTDIKEYISDNII